MARKFDRMKHSIVITNFRSSTFSLWDPPVDLYESDSELTVFIDVAGIESSNIKIIAEPKQVTVKGERECHIHDVVCVHQLEIEYGNFERTISLPKPIDVKKTTSEIKNGLLVVKMPLLKLQGTVAINSVE